MDQPFTDADKVYLQTQYNVVGDSLTPQHEKLVLWVFRGINVKTAADQLGMDEERAFDVLNSPVAMELTDRMRQRESRNIEITRDRLSVMLLDAHAKSANATEEISAIRELGKMHDLYLDSKGKGDGPQVNINITNVRQIERASDAQLMELAGQTIDLDPDSYLIENSAGQNAGT